MKLRAVAALGLTAVLALTACGGDTTGTKSETPASESAMTSESASATESGDASESAAPGDKISGDLSAGGASSMKKAQAKWIGDFAGVQPDIKVNYKDEGSGAGRDGFKAGGYQFAGSDRAFKVDENKAGEFKGCKPDAYAIDIPVYISPIAIVYTLEGVDKLDLTPEVAAEIFSGKITKWNDPKIADLNKDATLPDLDITVVHRKDKSGTTENFTDWLNKSAPEIWTEKADQVWKGVDGEAADQTAGMMSAVKGGDGIIGYADASQAKEVGIASVNGILPNSADAGKAIDASEVETEGRQPNDIAVKIDRKAEGYPVVLISYAIACSEYNDANVGKAVKAYFEYMVSEEAQKAAEEAAGSSPLPAGLAEKAKAAAAAIK